MVEHLYDYGMLLEALDTDVLTALEELVDHLDVAVDADVLARVFQLREKLLAKSMEPLRAFDELMLYQLSKAASTVQYLGTMRRSVAGGGGPVGGLGPQAQGDAVDRGGVARRDALEWPGPRHRRPRHQTPRRAVHATMRRRCCALSGRSTAKTPTKRCSAGPTTPTRTSTTTRDKPPREDEFFHSETGGRYFSKGSFGEVTGAVIDKAIELAEVDNPRDNDTRSPAQRRGEALADVCGFYVDYHNRVSVDPDADAPVVPKKRNWPQLIGVSTTD